MRHFYAQRNPMDIKIKKLHPNAKAPIYGTEDAGCFDLHAATVDGYSEI